jgi:hypothetical protein
MAYSQIIIFFAGLVGTTRITVVGGDLFATDILLSISFLLLLLTGNTAIRRLSHGLVGVIVLLGFLWLLNQIITDVYRGTAFVDWSRGWAKIVVFLVDFCGLVLLTDLQLERIITFFVGICFSLFIELLFFPNEFEFGGDFAQGVWKFGLAPALTTLAAIFGTTRYAQLLLGIYGEFAFLVVMGVVNLFYDYRSMFGLAIMAVAFGLLKRVLDRSIHLRAKVTPIAFVFLLMGGLVFAQGLIMIYSIAAGNGWLGEAARDKYEMQSAGNLNLLLSGRPESLVSVKAIADSPIVGHGSWARDATYVAMLFDILESRGIEVHGDIFEGELNIPAHSHLFGAWVEAGVMGGVFWVSIVVITLMALYRTLKRPDVPATFVSFVLVLLIWDVFFSPFGGSQRFVKAAQICTALYVLRASKEVVRLPETRRKRFSG